MNKESLHQRINSLKATIQRDQKELAELEEERKRQLELDNIPHHQAINKLRAIYRDACLTDDARDFTMGIIQDDQLRGWFGEV